MSIRIILVDDHALVREGIARLLDGQQDMRVIASFGAGRDAIRYAEREEAEVAVLDVGMPDLNGIEVARALQDASPETRIVMLSMHADSSMCTGRCSQARRATSSRIARADSARSGARRAWRARYVASRWDRRRSSNIFASAASRSARSPQRTRARVLQHTVEGRTIAETAERLQLSPKRVETYRSRLMAKLEIEDIPALVKFAFGTESRRSISFLATVAVLRRPGGV
jgi:two-component system invasion response regulator UvrY